MNKGKVKASKKTDYYREWLVCPAKGSNTHAMDPEGYDAIAAQVCPHCKKLIGEMVGMFLYHPSMQAAHIGCVEAAERREVERRENSFMIEQAAKLAKVTIAQFREFPSWEKDRWIEQVEYTKREKVRL